MRRLFLSFATLALLVDSTTTCGQKGPLYLPDDEKAKKEHSKDRYGF